MTKYELCLVLNQNLEEGERLNEIQKVKDYIARDGGTVIEPIEEWGKRKFAYEINYMKEGYYYFIPFEGVSKTPGELENQIRIMENVVRFLIVKQDELNVKVEAKKEVEANTETVEEKEGKNE